MARSRTTWKPGETGNGKGRPKDDPRTEFWRQFKDAVAEIKLNVALDGKPKRPYPCVEILTRKLVRWAMAEVEFRIPIQDDTGKVTGERKEILPIPRNPQMVRLFFDKCLGSEMVLSGSVGVDVELNAIAEALAQVIPEKPKGKDNLGS